VERQSPVAGGAGPGRGARGGAILRAELSLEQLRALVPGPDTFHSAVDALLLLGGPLGVLEKLGSSADTGLAADEAPYAERRARFATRPLSAVAAPPPSLLTQWLAQMAEPLNIILVLCAALSLGFGVYSQGAAWGWKEGTGILLAGEGPRSRRVIVPANSCTATTHTVAFTRSMLPCALKSLTDVAFLAAAPDFLASSSIAVGNRRTAVALRALNLQSFLLPVKVPPPPPPPSPAASSHASSVASTLTGYSCCSRARAQSR
jgi:hypothetical protein